jgi:hypothetical protein
MSIGILAISKRALWQSKGKKKVDDLVNMKAKDADKEIEAHFDAIMLGNDLLFMEEGM